MEDTKITAAEETTVPAPETAAPTESDTKKKPKKEKKL